VSVAPPGPILATASVAPAASPLATSLAASRDASVQRIWSIAAETPANTITTTVMNALSAIAASTVTAPRSAVHARAIYGPECSARWTISVSPLTIESPVTTA
jgi:hypothetical protein